jgi:hypothetical protein
MQAGGTDPWAPILAGASLLGDSRKRRVHRRGHEVMLLVNCLPSRGTVEGGGCVESFRCLAAH